MLCKSFLVFVVLALLTISDGRRGGFGGGFRGGSRGWSSRGSRSGSRSVSSYKPKPSYFDKGGFKTFAKVALGVYIARKLTPSIGFRAYNGDNPGWRTVYCHNCISINGSNPECDSGSLNTFSRCLTTLTNPYCSTEYGVLENNATFVRRSCNERTCQSCSKSGLREGKCYTYQCDMCNWDRCNSKSLKETFPAGWSGCIQPASGSSTYDAVQTCGAQSLKYGWAIFLFAITARLTWE